MDEAEKRFYSYLQTCLDLYKHQVLINKADSRELLSLYFDVLKDEFIICAVNMDTHSIRHCPCDEGNIKREFFMAAIAHSNEDDWVNYLRHEDQQRLKSLRALVLSPAEEDMSALKEIYALRALGRQKKQELLEEEESI